MHEEMPSPEAPKPLFFDFPDGKIEKFVRKKIDDYQKLLNLID